MWGREWGWSLHGGGGGGGGGEFMVPTAINYAYIIRTTKHCNGADINSSVNKSMQCYSIQQ